jgi:hypothetical protein
VIYGVFEFKDVFCASVILSCELLISRVLDDWTSHALESQDPLQNAATGPVHSSSRSCRSSVGACWFQGKEMDDSVLGLSVRPAEMNEGEKRVQIC